MDSSKVRVGMVAQPFDAVLPPRQNSIGIVVYNTAIELSRTADVDVILKHEYNELTDASLPFGVEAIETPWFDRIQTFASKHPRYARHLGIGTNSDDYATYARKVKRALTREAYPIVHVMNFWQWCKDLRQTSCRGLVLEMHCEWLAQMDHRKIAQQLKSVDAVVGVSDHIANQFRATFPDYRGHIVTAYNGVDIGTFSPSDSQQEPDNEQAILFVGRMSPEKGIHILLRAFADVVGKYPDARLELAGPRTTLPARLLVELSTDPVVRQLTDYYDGTVTDNYQQHLDELLKAYQLENNVRFLGSVPHEMLVEKYRSANVVVNPSYSESFGISVVEGMATGRPVIGTRIGGMAETIVDGETGILIPSNNADALSQAIDKILSDPTAARAMGTKGRERVVQQFSWRARAARLSALYDQLLSPSD